MQERGMTAQAEEEGEGSRQGEQGRKVPSPAIEPYLVQY